MKVVNSNTYTKIVELERPELEGSGITCEKMKAQGMQAQSEQDQDDK